MIKETNKYVYKITGSSRLKANPSVMSLYTELRIIVFDT